MVALADDPPCIVGMACRLPGDITSPEDLWNFLVQQKSAQGSVPPGRYNIDGFYHPKGGNHSGSTNVPGGYFINEDIREFDNAFFGINNLEATYMDPQQRKLLEVVFECLQSSGTSMKSIAGSTTGVFVGNFSVDYQPGQTRDPDYIHRYTATGSGATVMSNRISHVFNLQGPSFTVDTACSSSIYALHQALNALNGGDCDSAIVASANLIMSPELHIGAAKSGVLSPTGTCHTFDVSADGYGRAEGVNAIYIKRLSAARRDGNPIRAIIRGSAVNASGQTPGISLPSGEMQEVVIRKAYKTAGLDFTGTDYVECHGTGTPVGDPIEVDAVGRCFSPREGPPLLIGSVKTNVGHSEGASGLTSILKVVKAFENGQIPPTYGVKKLNPKLVLEERNLKIATEVASWPRTLRRAGVNSFGYGGANGHVVLESVDSFLGENPQIPRALNGAASNGVKANGDAIHTNGNHANGNGHTNGSHANGNGIHTNGNATNGNGIHANGEHTKEDGHAPAEEKPGSRFVLPVSASSNRSLKELVQRVSEIASQFNEAGKLQSLAHTLSSGRDHLRSRGYVVAELDDASGKVTVTTDEAGEAAEPLPFGFVFTGQGAQYAGMAKELLWQNLGFRDTIRGLDKVLQALPAPYAPSWTLEQTLLDGPETSRINEVARSQPICTAVQVGLVDMLRTWGIKPSSTVGHSSGEIAAAYAAGLLSASQAILVAYFRGYAVTQLRSQGQMLAAGLSPDSAKDLIADLGLEAQARVACVNSPESVTLSGSLDAVESLFAKLQDQQKFVRKLQTGGRAYHSHMMQEIGQLYEDLLIPVLKDNEGASFSKQNHIRMFSSVGHNPDELTIIDSPATVNARYWRQNLEQPVQFSAALATLASEGQGKKTKTQLLEVGPHSALKGPIQQIRKSISKDEKSLPYLSTLIRNDDADLRMKILAGSLFVRGYDLAWEHINPILSAKTQSGLPRYPWDYSGGVLWSEPRPSVEMRNRKYMRHELLGTAALTGNGIDFTWRNVLKPSEMPWIQDHKLEDQVVFPGAGYIAMAIEAVTQVTGLKPQLKDGKTKAGFELRHVNISAALPVPEENNMKDLELHTTMSLRKTSGANTSVDWHDFSISSLSWTTNQTTLHCTGSIRVIPSPNNHLPLEDTTTVAETDAFDLWLSMTKWYSKWHDEGLCFGPRFQSLTSLRTDSARQRTEAIATIKLAQPAQDYKTFEEFYPVHPITIDAGLQAACLSGTAGHVASLKTWLPVYLDQCYVQPPSTATEKDEGEIHVISQNMGFSSRRIDGTIRDATGHPVFDFKDSRIALYTGKTSATSFAQHYQQTSSTSADTADLASDPLELYLQRQPALRIEWKPDILRLDPETGTAALKAHVADFVARQHPDIRDDPSLAIIGAVLDLAGHKNPRMKVLELGGDAQGYKAELWRNMLGNNTAFPRCRSWNAGVLNEDGEISLKDEGVEGPFDVIVIPKHATLASDGACASTRDAIESLVSDRGMVIARSSEAAIGGLKDAGLDVFDVGAQVVLGVRPLPVTQFQGRNGLILQADESSPEVTEFASKLAVYLHEKAGIADVNIVKLSQISDVNVKETDVCVSLVELEHPFLPTMSPQGMDNLRAITDKATDLLWITGADMLSEDPNPNLTLSNGLSRALMLEQPVLRWSVLDIGHAQKQLSEPAKVNRACGNVVESLVARYEKDDCEFISADGLLKVSRYIPDFDANSLFRQRLDPQTVRVDRKTLAEANPARLTIGRPGVTDTMYFQQLSEPQGHLPPPPGYVDIEVKAVSLNAKDVYALNGRVETRDSTTAFDFSGVVTAVGPSKNSKLKTGDRVVAYAPFHIGTTVRVPTGCVHALKASESFTEVPTLLVAYATALYALQDRANLRKGESVLIHAGSGGFGVAAIALAQRMGATVYTTCGPSVEKRRYLVEELGVPESHIFNSREASSFVKGIHAATGGRGVDVIINSLVGDMLHDSWERCLADFGRFVEIGKRELLDAGRLDMRAFLRNVTFTAFDLSELFYSRDAYHRQRWDDLMAETLALYRAGDIRAPPMTVFPVTQAPQAYRFFGNKDRIGKVVISFEDPQAKVPVAPATYTSVFDADKVYLLVGCLGGLGGSVSRWMVSRGARNFVFLGRSGTDKPSARKLITRLQKSGATAEVVRGDVSQAADVEAAVKHCVNMGLKIGGVVQAAMGLHEALFTRMPNEAWRTGIDPKYQGTWNLHNALEGHDLDFFLLTSSVSGTVGTATESNYCSANGFLDAFARWRRSRGLACVSVGLGMISEVGYLHENPEIEALLLRKGIQPLNEDEFLQVVDLALSSEPSRRAEEAHMLTGLEPAAVRELSARGFDVTTHGVLVEARSSILLASLQAEKEVGEAAASGSRGAAAAASAAAAPWYRDVPASLAGALAPEASAESMHEAILALGKKRFSNLILMPLDQVDAGKPLPEFGVDSMIASEFRSWFWAVFRVDVPFLDLMSQQSSLQSIAEFVEAKALEAK
ncbi:Type I Iterative PKS [Diatrype stigma]|uniref:Type I Iterative PKS n=1 Tax=Diatrype stigma TaxID=117547 RepID=A0AAN9U409_9PEZI